MSTTKKRSGAELARQRDLAGHERVIENARQSFVDWGRALGKIRIEKLYEVDGYADFDGYVIERWEMRPQHAYRLITAARVALILSPMGYKITSERAARELAPVAEDTDMLRAVYEEADRRAGGGRVTAALIAAAREALAPAVIDGDWRDDDEAEISEVVGAMREAIETIEHKQASGLVDTSPVDESGENHPATAEPGDAAQDDASAEGSEADQGDETGTEDKVPPASSEPVDGPEQQGAGVSPAAPDPEPTEDDEQKTRREMRERMSQRFCEGIVTLTQGLARRGPENWLAEIYLAGAYKVGDMPGVAKCFTPDSLKELARQIYTLADHLTETGRELP